MAPMMAVYEEKLVDQQLVGPNTALMGRWDADLVWNRPHHDAVRILTPLFEALDVSALLFSPPAEPYNTLITALATRSDGTIHLSDNETRMFLHDIPVLTSFSLEELEKGLKQRKAVVVPGYGIVTIGTISPEQTFVNYSSVLFACFVKYFSDHLFRAASGTLSDRDQNIFGKVCSLLPDFPDAYLRDFISGPFSSEAAVLEAITQAGKPLVQHGLVDSVMGNISACYDGTAFISQTGSFLDGLEGAIDACPMDHSACTGITASSELPTHMEIYRRTGFSTIVHGHPKFSVIMSMFCPDRAGCDENGQCHTRCPRQREVVGIPVVPGETGNGPLAICRTVPKAVAARKAAIVYGHGVFCAGQKDFNAPFQLLWDIEKKSRICYFDMLKRCQTL